MYLPDCQITKENKQEEKIYFIKTHLLVFPSKKGFIDLLRIIKSIFSVNLYRYLITYIMYIPPSPGPITILSIFIKQQTRRVQTSMFSSYPGEFLLRLFRLIRHTHYCSEGNVMYLPVIQKWSILNIFLTMMSTCKFTNTHTMNKLCVLINWSALRP